MAQINNLDIENVLPTFCYHSFLVLLAFLSYKILKFIFETILLNYNLRKIPVNPCVKTKLFGYYQPCKHIPRWDRHGLAYEGSKKTSEDLANAPQGLTKFYILPFLPMIYVSSPKYITKILRSTKLVDKHDIYRKVIADTFGDNILVSKREIWKEKRRHLAKTMHKDLHGDYSFAINGHVRDMVFGIRSSISKSKSKKREIILDYAQDHGHTLALNILAENIFGQKLSSQAQKEKFLNLYDDLFKFMELRWSIPGLFDSNIFKLYCWWTGNSFNQSKSEFRKMIVEMIRARSEVLGQKVATKNTMESKKNTKTLAVDILLDLYSQKYLTFEEIINESSIFFMAALDTTVVAMNGSIYGLSHPTSIKSKIQQKLIDEIDKFFPEKSDLENLHHSNDGGQITAILANMPYLDAVVKESLRFYGPAPFVSRKSGTNTTIDLGDFKFNLGNAPTLLLLQTKHVSDELINQKTKDADQFKPERFLNNEVDVLDFSAFAPFSRGVRDCIGKPVADISMKMQLIWIYRNFRTEIFVRDEEDEKLDRKRVTKFTLQFEKAPKVRFIERE